MRLELDDDDLLTLDEVAEILRVKRKSLYDLLKRNRVPHYRVSGKIIRVRRGDLNELLKRSLML